MVAAPTATWSHILTQVADSLDRFVEESSAEIAKLRKNVTEGRALVARGAKLRSQWDDMQKNALPKDSAKAEQDLVTAFDRWGRAGGIELGSIKPQWKRGSSNRYSLLECRVDASGSLNGITRLLYEVEKSPLALRIDSIELTSRDDSGNRLTLGLLVSGLRFTPLEGRR